MAELQATTIQGDLQIDKSLSRPNLPMIDVGKSDGGGCYATTGPVPFNVVNIDVGGITRSLSNSRFTVPEDGVYWVGFWTIGHNNCGTTGHLRLGVNGTLYSRARSDASIRYGNCYAYRLFQLSEGDYVEANMGGAHLYFASNVYNRFVIFKVT